MTDIEVKFDAAKESLAQLLERISTCLNFPADRIVLSHNGNPISDLSTVLENIQTVNVTFLDENYSPLQLQEVLKSFSGGLLSVGLTWTFLMSIGFTSTGITAGSLAAGWMSSIALANGVGVTAGSIYALIQSAMMGGFLLSPIGVGALLVGTVAGWFSMRR